jgi:hypothetical protein
VAESEALGGDRGRPGAVQPAERGRRSSIAVEVPRPAGGDVTAVLRLLGFADRQHPISQYQAYLPGALITES